MSNENISRLLKHFTDSLQEEAFVKLTLAKYKGADEHLQRVLVRPLQTKKGRRLYFLFRYDTRDTANNFSLEEGAAKLGEMIGSEFFAAHLFTTGNDFQLDIGKKGTSRLNTSKPSFSAPPPTEHNREKQRFVRQDSFYLSALGVTTESGQIRDKQQDKWRQINRYVETLAQLVRDSNLNDRRELSIVDMGCGKGYLTFAAYDYFKNICGIDVTVTGIDTKTEIVELCNGIAKTCEFDGLSFVNGWIETFEPGKTDILIALHACDTATDDAIFKGIKASAELIVAAPCCHKEIRGQIKPPEMLSGILRHGIMLERTAETITDGLRSLLLERSGYATKIFEFISTEHTPKNNMLVGTKSNAAPGDTIQKQIADTKSAFGIKHQKLEILLTS